MPIKFVFWIVIGLAILGFAYYAISPLFRNITVNETLPSETPDATSTPPAEPPEVERFPIADTPLHPAEGFARIVDADGTIYVRYEDYKTINGPDLFVYLSKDLDAKEFVSLGELKATEGNINYEVPEDVNVEDYKYVLTWCKAFGVLFNSARLR